MDLVPTPYELPRSAVGRSVRRPVRRMKRPIQGRRIGGGCVGLGEDLGLNVRYGRLAFVLACLGGGAGIVAYLFLWALTPRSLGAPAVAGADAVAGSQPAEESVRNLVDRKST